MRLPATPAVVGDGNPATENRLAAAGLTVMPDWVEVPPPNPGTVAVRDRPPAVFRVAVKVCLPASAAVKV